MKNEAPPTIFVSYTHEDRSQVEPFVDFLENAGLDVWIDFKRIKPGQRWGFEIKRAFEKAHFVLAFVSSLSSSHRGFVQRELKLALDKRMEQLEDDIYLIPVLLDNDVQIPNSLKAIQIVRASEPGCKQAILDSINHQMERLGVERQSIEDKQYISWTTTNRKEEYEGLPGYEIELQILSVHSKKYKDLADVNDYIKAPLLDALFYHRSLKLEQNSTDFNYGQDKFQRTNTYDAHCRNPQLTGKVLSIVYSVNWYGAGAAHDQFHYITHNFLLDPVVRIKSLDEIFLEPEIALPNFQMLIRELLRAEMENRPTVSDPSDIDHEWIESGTKEWDDFSFFSFGAESIEVLFPPYQVACFADGTFAVQVEYSKVIEQLKEIYVSALNLDLLKR